MRVLQGIQQGSREWLAIRAKHHTASEAPAMMGESRYQQRDQLLHQKHTGITQEVDGHTQRLFDRGHATEAAARILLEQDLGDELYPVTALDDDGYLLASFDGINLMGDTGFEHKLWSERLAQQVRAGDLEPHYYWQLEQQILVGGLEKVIFVTSDGTRENWAQMEYRPAPGRAEQLLAGWAQFDADLAAYVPPESKAAPVVGRAPEHLPALRIEVTGQVTASNLAEFKATAMAAIADVNRELVTDADFADAEASVKWCSEIESRLAAAKQHALSQTVDVDALFRTMDDIAAEARRVRLELDKSIKGRKQQLRAEIVIGGVAALRKHIDSLNSALGRDYVPMVSADFGGAVKGKRSLDSIQGAVNDELARAKIAAGDVYARIQANLRALHSTAGDCLSLFADLPAIVTKAPDDFAALVHTRVAQHQAAEQKRLDAERERIRAEEAAKLQRQADDKARAEAAEQERQQREQAAAAQRQADEARATERAAQAITQAAARQQHVDRNDHDSIGALFPGHPAASAALDDLAGFVDALVIAEPTDTGERINLGAINEHLSPIKLDAAGLALLGFEPVATVKASKLYRTSDLARIRVALMDHLARLAELETA